VILQDHQLNNQTLLAEQVFLLQLDLLNLQTDPNVDQNLWLNIAADVGGPVAANTTTDTLTIAGGSRIRTNIAGDTVTVNMTGSPFTAGGSGDIGSPFLDVRGGDGITVTTGSPRLTIAVDSTVARMGTGSPPLGNAGTFRLVSAGSPRAYADFGYTDKNLTTDFSKTERWDVSGVMPQFSSTVPSGSPTGYHGFLITDTRDIASGEQTALLRLDGTYTGSNQARNVDAIQVEINNALANFNGKFLDLTANVSGTQAIYKFVDYNITMDRPNGNPSIYSGVVTSTDTWTTSRELTHLNITTTLPSTTSNNYNHKMYNIYSDLIATNTEWNAGSPTNAFYPKWYGIYSKIDAFNSDNIDAYALYLNNVNSTASHYGLYQAQSGVSNYFAGNVGFGVVLPSTALDTDGTLRIRDGGQTDWADFSHNGTDFVTSLNNTTDYRVTGAPNFQIEAGSNTPTFLYIGPTVLTGNNADARLVLIGENSSTLYGLEVAVNSASATLSGTTSGAATSAVTSLSASLNINVTSGNQLWIRDGGNFRISDSGDANYIDFIHDGNDLNLRYTNTRTIAFGSPAFALIPGSPSTVGMYVRNTLTGTGLERVLTKSDLKGGSPNVAVNIVGGTGISVTTGSPQYTITNTDPNVDQNLWLNIAADVGGPVAANTTTDTLTIAGGKNVRTNIAGDTVTVNMTGSPFTGGAASAGSPLLDIRGGDGIDVTFGSPKVTIAVDATVARDGDNISTFVNDAGYLKTIGSPFLDVRAGAGISVAFGSPRLTITNTDKLVA
jgi:hypothetical protein